MNTPGEHIPALLQEYIDNGKQISNSVYQILLYGHGITREEAFNMTYEERCEVVKLIEEKIKVQPPRLF